MADKYSGRTWIDPVRDKLKGWDKQAMTNTQPQDPLATRARLATAPAQKPVAAPPVRTSAPVAATPRPVATNQLLPSHGTDFGQQVRKRFFGSAPAGSQGFMKNEGTGEVFPVEGAQDGYSRPGGFGLNKGGGSFSAVDMSGLPDKSGPVTSGIPGPPAPQASGRGAAYDDQASRLKAYSDKLFADRRNPSPAATTAAAPAKDYKALYSDKGARSAAMSRDARIADIMARKQQETDAYTLKAQTDARQVDLGNVTDQARLGLEGARTGADIAANQAKVAESGYNIRGGEPLNALKRQMLSAKTDEERTAIGQQIAMMGGNVPQPKEASWSLEKMPTGEIVDMTAVEKPVLVSNRGEIKDVGQGAGAKKISPAQLDKLKSSGKFKSQEQLDTWLKQNNFSL